MKAMSFLRKAALAFSFAGAALVLGGCGKPAPSAANPSAPPSSAGTLELTFTYGSEKENWIKETVGTFNAQNHRLASGKTVRVNALPMGSGECLDEIIAGTRQTDLVSPASGAYIDIGNARWRAKNGGRDLVAKTDNLLLSPVVIGIWKPMAEALGWGQPARRLGGNPRPRA